MLVNLFKKAVESVSNTLAKPQQDIINRKGERERRRTTDYATMRRDNPVFSSPRPKTANMPVVALNQKVIASTWYALYSFGPYNNQPISDAYRNNFTKKYNSSQF